MAAEAVLAEDLKGNNAQGANPSQTLEPPVAPSAKSVGLQEPSKAYVSSASSASQKEPQESKDEAVAAGADDLPVSSVQKKILRAERFGISVQLSEQEKRNCRAERFGTGPTQNKSDGLNKSEDLKRKERAERFGLPSVSVPNDVEAKKKARQERFATGSKTDSMEENKRKARAARFSDPPLKSESQTNGKDSIHPKLAIGGKGGEES